MFCTYVLGPDIFTNGSLSGYIGRLPTNERVCLFTVVLLFSTLHVHVFLDF